MQGKVEATAKKLCEDSKEFFGEIGCDDRIRAWRSAWSVTQWSLLRGISGPSFG